MAIALPSGGPHATEAAASDDQIRVELADGSLAVTLGNEVPLERVLEAIAREAGLRLKTRGELGTVRPQAFEGRPLADGIRRVVGDNRVNLMLRYQSDSDGGRRLVEVRAYEAHEGSMSTPIAARRERPPPWRKLPRVPPPPPPAAAPG